MNGRPRLGLLATAEGTRPDAFGAAEWALLLTTAGIWGSSYFWIELGLRSLHPGVVAMARVVLGLVVISSFSRARVPIAKQDRGRLVLLGLGWFGLPMLAFPLAQHLGVASSVVGMLNAAVPLTTTLFASLLLRRRPAGRQVVGLLLGFLGMAAIVGPRLRGADATALGMLLVLTTMVANSLLANVLVPMQQRYGALAVLRGTLTVALVLVVPAGLVGLPSSTPTVVSLAAMLPLGALSTAVAFVTWTTLIGRAGASRASVVSYLVPVVAVALGVGLLGEVLPRAAALGAGAVLLGAWLVTRRDRAAARTAVATPPIPTHALPPRREP